jgi:predicted dehydrogenase
MFVDPLVRDYRANCRLAAFCDLSSVRMEFHKKRLFQAYGVDGIATYPAEQFDRMLQEQKPDVVIICTVDAAHCDYILRSVRHGCDVICEKPVTTTAEQCAAMLREVPESGRNVRVTFNVRWIPGISQLRRLVAEGGIGKVRHVSLDYMLNTVHGADYFRRWHSDKESSGGLLVHKSTHHFDMVNWLVDSIPETVSAMGDLVFYGKKNAVERGDGALTGYDRYTGAPAGDPYSINLQGDDSWRGLYVEAEQQTGYIRDRNVFREGITIEDSMSVLVRYRNGVMLNYSLNAYCPYEGFRLCLNGDRGRLEFETVYPDALFQRQRGQAEFGGNPAAVTQRTLKWFPLFGEAREIPVDHSPGSHGGGDPLLQRQMFSSEPPEDPLGRSAGYEQGIASAIIGIAGNQSIATGKMVLVSDLIQLAPAAIRLRDLV